MVELNVGADIRKERERLNLSLEAIAKMADVPVATVCRWEQGELKPSRLELWGLAGMLESYEYKRKLEEEMAIFSEPKQALELPEIFHYWSNKHLVSIFREFGFENTPQLFSQHMIRMCERFADETCHFVSIGAGNCDLEIKMVEDVLSQGVVSFHLECLDINNSALERGRLSAQQKSVFDYISFCEDDVNSWAPDRVYHLVIAIHSLHHVVKLESLFDQIGSHLHPQGYFLADDMIGRNGHKRWPEALEIVQKLWQDLPRSYRYNHLLQRHEEKYENWDCSTEGWEGIRSQDILPLLMERFGFEMFIGYSNIIDIFIERCFGHNFDLNNEWDRSFIDRVHALDEKYLEEGRISPTHMVAAMTHSPVSTKVRKNLTPQFCLRRV